MKNGSRSKDEQFEQLYIAHFPKVKNFASALTTSSLEADDIAQCVFLKLWSKPELWHNTDCDIDSYLYAMTRNEIFATFRHRAVEREFADHAAGSALLEELCEEAGALKGIYYRELLLLVEMALTRMPAARSRAFRMSRFEEKSNKEIAQELQLPLRTVEDHIYRTLKELRQLLKIVIFILLLP